MIRNFERDITAALSVTIGHSDRLVVRLALRVETQQASECARSCSHTQPANVYATPRHCECRATSWPSSRSHRGGGVTRVRRGA
eukprot:3026456-Rhodomonas_salina.1